MYVYFIRCLDTEFVKIGKATNIDKRIADMQTGCPYQLSLMFKVNCGSEKAAYEMEKRLHKTFRANLHRSEWFKLRGSDFKKMITEFEGLEVSVGEFDKKFVTPRAIRRKKKREKKARKSAINERN